jgi:hypothetical protein
MRHPGLDGGDGVGHRARRVVLAVDAEPGDGLLGRDAERGGEPLADLPDRARDARRQHAAVGVAHHRRLGPGGEGGRGHAGRVVGVDDVPVEEVLAVEEDAAALADEVRDGVPDHCEVLLAGGPQRPLDVPDVGLGDQGHGRGLGVEQGSYLRVVLDAYPRLAGRPERDEDGMPEIEFLAGPLEELGVLGQGAGPAALDEPDAELVEQPGDRELVDHRVADGLALGPVAQGGVVNLHLPDPFQQKDPPRMREVCASSKEGWSR